MMAGLAAKKKNVKHKCIARVFTMTYLAMILLEMTLLKCHFVRLNFEKLTFFKKNLVGIKIAF